MGTPTWARRAALRRLLELDRRALAFWLDARRAYAATGCQYCCLVRLMGFGAWLRDADRLREELRGSMPVPLWDLPDLPRPMPAPPGPEHVHDERTEELKRRMEAGDAPPSGASGGR